MYVICTHVYMYSFMIPAKKKEKSSYPNIHVSELGAVPIGSDNRGSTVHKYPFLL